MNFFAPKKDFVAFVQKESAAPGKIVSSKEGRWPVSDDIDR